MFGAVTSHMQERPIDWVGVTVDQGVLRFAGQEWKKKTRATSTCGWAARQDTLGDEQMGQKRRGKRSEDPPELCPFPPARAHVLHRFRCRSGLWFVSTPASAKIPAVDDLP